MYRLDTESRLNKRDWIFIQFLLFNLRSFEPKKQNSSCYIANRNIEGVEVRE